MDTKPQPGFDVGDYHVVPESRLLIGPDGSHRLCEAMIALLSELAAHAGQPVHRRQIIEDVWHGAPGADRALTRSVSRLRHYLHDDSAQARYIETLPGQGYRLVADVRTQSCATEVTGARRANPFWSFLLELRQRKVCRAALVYAVVVWLIYQIAEIVLPALGAPPWILAAVVVLGVFGFPIALVLSWTFEITPEGLRVDDASYRSEAARQPGRWEVVVNAGLIGTAVLLSAQLLYSGLGTADADPARSAHAGIRTLALATFSQGDANADSEFLGRELTTELRHRLRGDHGLRIVSLESIGALHRDVPSDVEALLLGSVRVDEQTARLSVYIVDRATGHDVWSGVLEQPREPAASLVRRLAAAVAGVIPTGSDSKPDNWTERLARHRSAAMLASVP